MRCRRCSGCDPAARHARGPIRFRMRIGQQHAVDDAEYGGVEADGEAKAEKPNFQFDGFIPTLGRIDPNEKVQFPNALDQDETAMQQAGRPYSERKLGHLRALAAQASRDDTLLVLFHTPLYVQDPKAHRLWTDRLRGVLAKMPPVAFVDICGVTHPDVFTNRPEIYNDSNHLNEQGAVILSTMLADVAATPGCRPCPRWIERQSMRRSMTSQAHARFEHGPAATVSEEHARR
jgi:lysophospholipase L1-like esterase